MILDWLIVGGGIHGVHIAVRLLEDGGVPPARLAVVDPEPRLMDRWRARAEATGMTFLRSPSMHHIDSAPYALQSFAARRRGGIGGHYTAPNRRPALDLFHRHSEHVIGRLGLARQHLQARVQGIELGEGAARVELDDGRRVGARRVVLAVGSSEQLPWPDWAPRGHPRIHHVFDPEGRGQGPFGPVVGVLGGGVTAAQVALRLARAGHRVALISRHALRTSQYDSDPGWHGPKFMTDFARIQDPVVRRARITEGRHRGTMPPDVYEELLRTVERGAVRLHLSRVARLTTGARSLVLELESGRSVEVEDLVLATGFAAERPGGAMVDRLIAAEGLPCAPCGFPLVDAALRWHPRIHVSGPLAELELGPVAGNISGARRAGARILGALTVSV
ncbi:MAG: FAD/NAD(P)-binding protein [Planctomycetota bacterium]|jgi:thioredoxin reductase